MPSLGSLWYGVMLKDMTDADYKKIEQKLSSLGIRIDASTIRRQIEAAVGATPFNATVSFGNARASLDAIFSNNQYSVHVNAIASRLHASIKAALDGWSGAKASILPKKAQLRKAVTDALLASGFEINVNKVKGLSATINGALNSQHTLNVSVDPKKLASAIEKAAKAYKGKDISVEIKDKVLKDSIRAALRTEKFPIRVIVDKAEAQDAVRQALQAAGLQSRTGFTASDKRAWDAESRRMEAQARVAAQNALAQRRLAGAHNTARAAADAHVRSSISLGAAMRGNIHIAGELGPMLASAYSIVALKSFLQKVVEIGGELEKQHLAVKAILGDEGMANTISSQINALAVKSPFGIMELNQYAKQLTAFQIPYNELYDTMKRMADVSAAVGVDMGRIILAYGQVRAAKFLKGTELRQFTEANIPLIDMLAERFTKLKGEIVSAADIMDMISNKEVSFEDVKAVLWELTGEGGKFYNMQEVLSESVQAKWKNLADAIDLMYADIADSLSKPLKGTAEILTELTSKWSTIATVAGVAATTFGTVKVASLLMARSLNTSGTSALKAAANSALLERRNARVAKGYRDLTRDERKALDTSIGYWGSQKNLLKSLSGEQFRQLSLTGQITKEEWRRMIALGRLSDVQKRILVQTGALTQSELDHTRVLSRNLLTLEGWKRAFLGVGGAIRSVGRAIGSIFLNPVFLLMSALGGVAALWQKNNAEAEKAAQLGEDLFTASAEGAKNLKQILESTPALSKGLNEVELSSSVEKLRQAIKNYSSTSDKDLLGTLINQEGEVASLAEQYDALREKVQQLKRAMDENVSSQISKTLATAIDEADSGLFNDNLITDIQDYVTALNNSEKYLAKAIKENRSQIPELVKMAKEASPEFAIVASSLKTDEQAFAELIRNYTKFAVDFDESFNRKLFGFYSDYVTEFGSKEREFEKEFRETLTKQMELLAASGITPNTITEEQKLNLVSWFDKVTESLPEKGKQLAREVFEKMWEIDLDDGRAEQAIIDTFGSAFTSAQPELSKRLKAGLSLKDVKFIDYAGAAYMVSEAAAEVLAKMPHFSDTIQNYLNDNGFIAKILVEWQALNQDSDIKKMLWSGDEKNLRVEAFSAEKIFDRMASGASSSRDVRDNYVKEGKDLQERIKAAKANNAAAKELEKLNAEWNVLSDSFRRAHFGDLKAAIKEKKGGDNKDAFAESLKQRFKDIKDAWSEFQKWSKTEGREAAAKRIGESGLFSTLSADEIPQTVEEYRALVEKLKTELQSAGVKGTAREGLFNDLLKQLLDIVKTVVDEQLNKAKAEIDALVSETTKKWDFYKKLFEFSGDKKTSMRIAFGGDVAWTDATQQLQNELENRLKEKNLEVPLTVSDEEAKEKLKGTALFDLWKKVKDAIEKDGIELRVDLQKAVYEASSIADKIKTQEGLRNAYETELRTKIPDITDNEVVAALKPYNDKIEELKSSMLELLPIWEQIFGDHQYQSYGQIQAASDVAKQIIDNAKINKDANGKPISFTSVYTDVEGNEQQIMGKISQLEKLRKAIQDLYKEGLKKNPFVTLWESLKKVFNGDWKDKNITEKLALIGESAAESADLVGNLAGQLANMFDAMGNDSMGQAMADVQDAMNSVSNIGKGFAQGGIVGGVAAAAGEAIGWITKLFQRHDAKLQKMIERSKQAAQIMQNQYDILEKQMASFLGNAANMRIEGYEGQGGAYGKQRELMQGQLAELEKQRQLEMDKKKSDDSVVEDYNKQIEEMKISIRDFAQEAANAIYGIDLKSWASELGDALFEAWKKGEDGAEAFKRKASEIIGTVLNNIFRLKVLEPMMQQLADDLFGKDGEEGIFGKDFELTSDEVLDYVVTNLMKIGDAAKDYAEFMDEAEKRYQKETGESLKDMGSKSSMTAGIQSLTEDTGSLLASYFNAFRADASEQTHVLWPRLLDDVLPQMNVIAQSQLDAQRQIAENTLRNAIAAEAIQASTAKLVELNDQMSRSWRRIAERNWAYS